MSDDEAQQQLLREGPAAFPGLFDANRARLARMVELRLDPHARSRIDPDDVLQQAFLDGQQRLHHYLAEPRVSFYVWLRGIVQQTLIDFHRRQVGAQMRSAKRDVSLGHWGLHTSTSAMSQFLLADSPSPSQQAMRAELHEQLVAALEQMSPLDREVLVLRHFEELDNHQIAEILGISQTAASNRYIRALARLRTVVESLSIFRGA